MLLVVVVMLLLVMVVVLLPVLVLALQGKEMLPIKYPLLYYIHCNR